MAELATIARPYADAFYEVSRSGDAQQSAVELDAVARVAADPQLRQFADSPKAEPQQVLDLISAVVDVPLSDHTRNLLRMMIDNGRLAALPEVAAQFRSQVEAQSGVSHAVVYSAYPIDEPQLASVGRALEKRFGRRLRLEVEIEPELIGGVRVVVGDQVLDTSVKARLQQMKTALTA